MSSNAPVPLRSLRDRPFDLLREMERRARAARASQEGRSESGDEWVGIACRIADTQMLVRREEVREVLMLPKVTPVPGARIWLKGLANVRGQLLPLTDLITFLGSRPRVPARRMRVLVVNHRHIPAGVIVEEVSGFRRFLDSERVEAAQVSLPALAPYLAGGFSHDGEILPVLDLGRLIESERFLQAAQS